MSRYFADLPRHDLFESVLPLPEFHQEPSSLLEVHLAEIESSLTDKDEDQPVYESIAWVRAEANRAREIFRRSCVIANGYSRRMQANIKAAASEQLGLRFTHLQESIQ